MGKRVIHRSADAERLAPARAGLGEGIARVKGTRSRREAGVELEARRLRMTLRPRREGISVSLRPPTGAVGAKSDDGLANRITRLPSVRPGFGTWTRWNCRDGLPARFRWRTGR